MKRTSCVLTERLGSDDEDLGSSDEGEAEFQSDGQDAAESADGKRLRLARQYLDVVNRETARADEAEKEDDGEDAVASRLQRDADIARGRYVRPMAQRVFGELPGDATRQLRGHDMAVTSVALAPDDSRVYSGSKDGTVGVWDTETGRRIASLRDNEAVRGRKSHILSVAVSSDGRLLASGGRDGLVRVWDARANSAKQRGSPLASYQGHRGYVSGVCFQQDSHQLYSSGEDRLVKLWNCDELAYVDTLFGHQSEVLAVASCGTRERCVTSSADGTVRVWKIVDESQLVFRYSGASSNVDAVAVVNDNTMVSGAQDGRLSVWSTLKKKPASSVDAHVAEQAERSWISAVAAVPFSDLVASGAGDGRVRLWSCKDQKLLPLLEVPVKGWVNGLALGGSGTLLAAAIGKEQRLGRWAPLPGSRNCVTIVRVGEMGA